MQAAIYWNHGSAKHIVAYVTVPDDDPTIIQELILQEMCDGLNAAATHGNYSWFTPKVAPRTAAQMR